MPSFRRFMRAFARNRTIAALSRLSDSQLRDIGIETRSSIPAYVGEIYA